MSFNNLFEPLVLTLGMVAVISFIVRSYISTKHSQYDMELKRSELELMRKSLESKIYNETDKLTAKESRWRDVNHLVVEAQNYTDDNLSHRNNFFHSAGVNIDKTEVDKRKVFILTPFHDKYDKAYDAIKSVCEDAGLSAYRGDEQYVRGNILSHIINEIASSSIVIANIDGRNPNVFYELGIVHAMNKPVIMLSSNIEGVPFDLQSQRIIIYNSINALKSELNSALTNIVVNG